VTAIDAPPSGLAPHWRELYREVVDTGLCTGCAACVMACPRDVLGYSDGYLPIQTGAGMAHDECAIGDRGCDICTRSCPRFRTWESDIDTAIFGRERRRDEVAGQYRTAVLTRTTDAGVAEVGQDGGLVSSLLIWGLEQGLVDGALTSQVVNDGRGPFDTQPTVATTREEVLATAGSSYTYSPNPLAMEAAEARGLERLALVGMSCQASVAGAVTANGVTKYARRIAFTIGLFCAKTFTYEGQREVLAAHGIDVGDVIKVQIKGTYQAWTRDGKRHVLPLAELRPHIRAGCELCPDFAAEHADISTGGIGDDHGWSLTLVRTVRGEEWLRGLVDAGRVEVRPAEEDPAALALLDRLSTRSRRRWPAGDDVRVAAGADRPGLLPIVASPPSEAAEVRP
jgi:coenzyme F420 hydrogenase subunit beta